MAKILTPEGLCGLRKKTLDFRLDGEDSAALFVTIDALAEALRAANDLAASMTMENHSLPFLRDYDIAKARVAAWGANAE